MLFGKGNLLVGNIHEQNISRSCNFCPPCRHDANGTRSQNQYLCSCVKVAAAQYGVLCHARGLYHRKLFEACFRAV